MKRLLTMAAMAIFVSVAAMAQIGESSSKKIETTYTTTTTTVTVQKYPSKGYSGMFEANFGYGSDLAFGFSTVHGYQFNPYVFVGAGIGLNVLYDNGVDLPIFADVRGSVPFGTSPVSFFGDVRLGYGAVEDELYFSPSIGLRFGRSKAATIALGYEFVQEESLFTFRVGFEW